MNSITRRDYATGLLNITKGLRLKGFTNDTLTVTLLCAQFVRQAVESIEGITPGTWEVAGMALSICRERGRPGNRYASDYEAGAIRLGLQKEWKDIETGDVGYWPLSIGGIPYGHTAIAIEIDGKMYWLENIDLMYRPNSKTVYPLINNSSGKKVIGRVMLTPLNELSVPRTLISPTKAIRDQKKVDVIVDPSVNLLIDQIGDRIFIIEKGSQKEIGTLEKATGVGGKVYLKIKSIT